MTRADISNLPNRLRLSEAGHKVAESALRERFGGNKSELAGRTEAERTTIYRFFRRENLRFDQFEAICVALNLLWEEVGEVADISGRSEAVSDWSISSEVEIDSPPSRKTTLVVRRHPATAQYFTEPLLIVKGDALPLDMVLIPAGTFMMGSPEDELERLEREGPQHEVSIPSFFMGQYPITQAQWRVVTNLPQVERELNPGSSSFKGENRPVECVSWHDAVEFCKRLEAHTKRPYRLPSEAEWEYACRAGTDTPFYFGKTLTTELANYDGNHTYNGGPKREYRKETTPVDHFGIANALGLCDMHGNVLEWCADDYHDTYEDAPDDSSAWISSGESKILRGGSWYDFPRNCRSAYRSYFSPDFGNHFIGFRVVCSAPRTV